MLIKERRQLLWKENIDLLMLGLLNHVSRGVCIYTLISESSQIWSSLISAEEIAFYRGEDYEKNVIERGYFALVKHVNRVLRMRVWHGMLEEGIVKWLWGSFGVSE